MRAKNYFFIVASPSTHPEDLIRSSKKFNNLRDAREDAKFYGKRVYKVKTYPDSGDIEYIKDMTYPKR